MSWSRERERERREGKRGGEGGRGMERQRERQPIRLGDDSPMLGIYSIRREGGRRGGGGARGQTVWEAARTASSRRRQGVAEGETETAEIKHQKRKRGGKEGWWEGQSREGGWKTGKVEERREGCKGG